MLKLEQPCTIDLANPLKRAMRILEGKYSIYILLELMEGAKRYSELHKNIPGISPKTLSDKLRYYVAQGIVTRMSYPEIPPKVEYTLTQKGEALKSVIEQLRNYGKLEEANNSVMQDLA